MSQLIDTSAALVAPTRLCAPTAWRDLTGSTKRRSESFAQHITAQHMTAQHLAAQDERVADGGAYVTPNQHFSIRSGPPTSR